MNSNSGAKLSSGDNLWLRALYMLILAVVFGVCETILYLLAIISLIHRVIKGENNQHIVTFGGSLGRYIQQIANYLTFNTDRTPFPFDTWPGNEKPASESIKSSTNDIQSKAKSDNTQSKAEEPRPYV